MESAKVYEFTSRGMRAIEVDSSIIGQRVRQAHKYEVGTICETAGNGYTVIFADGSESHGQTFGARSPFCCIDAVDEPRMSSDDVQYLRQLRDQMRITSRQEREDAAKRKVEETKILTEAMRARYPHAAPASDKVSGPARAAKNMRAELKAKFPGVKFSVRSKSYSGGSSIDVDWTDGPTSKQVNKVISKYSDRDFDGMTDSTNFDHSALGDAVDIVLGRAGYVFGHREVTIRDRVKADLIARYKTGDVSHYDADRMTNELLGDVALPLGFEYKGLRWNDQTHKTEVELA